MGKKRTKRQQAIIRRRVFLSLCAVLLIAAIVAVSLAVNAIIKVVKQNEDNGKISSSESSSYQEPKEPYVVSSATVINTGDILIHSTVLDGARMSDGTYDFSAFFPKVKEHFKKADLAVANLEVTLGGTESGKFSGYPAFNTPDSLADVIKDAGIGLLLTSNNHCYDTGKFGLKRTASVLKEKGIDFIGTRETEQESFYTVKNVNGVKLGMTVYTYENSAPEGKKSINGNLVASDATGLINSFSYERLEEFYADAQKTIDDMKNAGADAVVFYMHWGEEYQLSQNTWQKTIAQKLCNMGVDVIVGGHPHVVQPIEMLTSEDSQNTTVCLYSLGNAISNQRKELMNPECTTGHTEDGVLFSFTFDKYSDGAVVLSGVDIIPTWVNKYRGGSGYLYTMYPLESPEDGAELFGLSGDIATRSKQSYERTKAIVMQGLTDCQTKLGCKVRFTEE